MGGKAWKEFLVGFERWLKLTCYLGYAWVFLDILPLLPRDIADRLVSGLLNRVGL